MKKTLSLLLTALLVFGLLAGCGGTPASAPASSAEAPASEAAPEPEPDPEPVSKPAFDLDAPYVSEFAKDLAEMKAREAAEAGIVEEDAYEGAEGDGSLDEDEK